MSSTLGKVVVNNQVLTYQKLHVYQCAIGLLALSARITEDIPRGNSAIVDQLKRAALSIPLNIAEAVGKSGGTDRSRFYEIARGSVMECGAILDVCQVLRLVDTQRLGQARSLVVRVVSMLTKITALNRRCSPGVISGVQR